MDVAPGNHRSSCWQQLLATLSLTLPQLFYLHLRACLIPITPDVQQRASRIIFIAFCLPSRHPRYFKMAMPVLLMLAGVIQAPVLPTKPIDVLNVSTITWVPITTTWLHDPRCTENLFRLAYGTTIAIDSWMDFFACLTCLPPQATPYWSQHELYPEWAITTASISVGPTVCPEAYTTASQSELDWQSTIIFCCPS